MSTGTIWTGPTGPRSCGWPARGRSDAANRLSTVTDWNARQTAYAYDDANRMTTATLPNGVVGTSTYDNANRLTGISYVKGGTTLASASYSLDAVGSRTSRTDLTGTQTYAYWDGYEYSYVIASIKRFQHDLMRNARIRTMHGDFRSCTRR